MKFILRIVLSALVIILLSYFLPAIHIDGFTTGVILAVVLIILNLILKPILVILTIPLTIITLGLFLFVINAIIILVADYFISGFRVDGFIWALIFSFILSISNSIIDSIVG